jgi:hypothetical protein
MIPFVDLQKGKRYRGTSYELPISMPIKFNVPSCVGSSAE